MLSVEPATLRTRSCTPGTAFDTPALQPVRSRSSATVDPPLPMMVPASREETMARRSTAERLVSVEGEPDASAAADDRGVPRLARGPRGARLAGVLSAAGESGDASSSVDAAPAGAGESAVAGFFLRGVRLDVLGLAAAAGVSADEAAGVEATASAFALPSVAGGVAGRSLPASAAVTSTCATGSTAFDFGSVGASATGFASSAILRATCRVRERTLARSTRSQCGGGEASPRGLSAREPCESLWSTTAEMPKPGDAFHVDRLSRVLQLPPTLAARRRAVQPTCASRD